MTYKAEKIVPYSENAPKHIQIEKMFDAIAGQYDVLNHLLSFGIDRYWRKKGILSLKSLHPRKIADIATGTGDLALQAYRLLQPQAIVAVDISEEMMQIGRKKTAELGLSGVITFEKHDCRQLAMETGSFDAAMAAFGVRNFGDLDKSLQEILRVLRPGGKLMILELSSPEYFPMKQLYRLYSQTIIPFVGRMVSKNKTAYTYLPRSVAAFPQNKEMQAILEKNGFRNVRYQTLTWGICTMYIGEKSKINLPSDGCGPSATV
ncbi:MAG: bifunctional demethylmenaquinone methyltransferase/2-methoxy-6-polyprenyl-1,4-benzoquinol methylase UbiE [Dysgonamonadaceae bacterium]|jgi:demethylmenaquinone methyltransferase/2-methoxy-6-polyprenyl-1,4-benzoquinol methylase|nr:bifunctional demethylmenaquinone methyltransferase/2-methoxy-6-polyprenyl-1,4-benzoquinol methylase UbiE [Dysgonamonadaceae bacterium]